MKTLVLSIALCAALAGCKKKEDNAATAAGSAAMAAGSGAAAAGSAAMAAGSAAEKAAEAAGSAAAAAGEAAMAAGSAAEAAAKMAEAAGAAGAPAGPRPKSVTDAHVALADKLVATLTKMATNVGAAGKDCKKAAEAIKASAKDLAPIKAEVDKLESLSKNDPAVKAWFESNYMGKMMGAMGPMMSVAQTCASDKDFGEAMQNLDMK